MLGAPVVAELVRRGHDIRVLTRTPPAELQPGSTHHAVDLVTGAGLRDALAGVDAVIEAANTLGLGRKAWPVLVDGTRRLLEAEAREEVGHHVAVSIVGIDAVAFAYYEGKLAQERLVEQGPVAWSIVRATQFHQLLDWVFSTTARAHVVPGNRFAVAPVDPRVVAGVMADVAEAGPGGRVATVAGPHAAPLREHALSWAQARARRVLTPALPLPRRTRRALATGALVPGDDAITGGPSFRDWLRAPHAPAMAAACTR